MTSSDLLLCRSVDVNNVDSHCAVVSASLGAESIMLESFVDACNTVKYARQTTMRQIALDLLVFVFALALVAVVVAVHRCFV